MLQSLRQSYGPGARRGFTLIELLLVLLILTALAAIIIPRFTKRSEDARITAARADVTNMGLSLDSFEIDTGRYPTTQEGLDVLNKEPTGGTGWHGPYLKREISNDPWGHPYVYECPGQHNTKDYDLYSYGPDGQQGGGDDIDNWSKRTNSKTTTETQTQ